MPFDHTIQRVRTELQATFAQLDAFCELPIERRQFRLTAESWTVDEILEHVTLTNHFLMVTLRQSLTKVVRRAQEQAVPEGESRLDRITRISDPDAFGWIRPEHMEPTRAVSIQEVRLRLQMQQEECLAILNQIPHGEGALHQVRMSVQELGKLDMYEWLYFLIQHARRHGYEIQRLCDLPWPKE